MKTLLALFALGFANLALAAGDANPPPATAAGDDPYPLKTCVVSGKELGSMGEPYVLTHTEAGKPDREVRLCCAMCQGRFNSAPAKYLAKLDAATGATTSATAPAGKTGKSCCGGGGCAMGQKTDGD